MIENDIDWKFKKIETQVKEENPALENELINTILSNPDSDMAKSLSKSKLRETEVVLIY